MPKPKLIWLLNDKELTNKDNVKFETDAKTFTNSLVIPKISASHLGKYVIKASNNVGEIEHTFNLDVLGKKDKIKNDINIKIIHSYQLISINKRNTQNKWKTRKCNSQRRTRS